MAFAAPSFIYDGVPCEDFGLIRYDIGSARQEQGIINDGVKIIQDTTARRARPIHYGTSFGDPIEFDLIFGALKYIDRADIAAIAAWLAGRTEFAPLVICQTDLSEVRYHALITSLETIQLGGFAVAFRARVVCDAPYAYLHPESERHIASGSSNFVYMNRSSVGGLYYPIIDITLNAGSNFKLFNSTTSETVSLEFGGANTTALSIYIDGERQLIAHDESSTSIRLNLYDYLTLNGDRHIVFPRFARGANHCTITGNCSVKLTSEFPVWVGH